MVNQLMVLPCVHMWIKVFVYTHESVTDYSTQTNFKSLMGPLFSKKNWEPRGNIPCSPHPPSQWACLYTTILGKNHFYTYL